MSRLLGVSSRWRVQRVTAIAIATIVSITSFIPAAAAVAAPLDPVPTPDAVPAAPAAQPSQRVELPERRTATSNTFDLGGGRLQTEFSPGPIHYRPDGATEFLPIELDFAADPETNRAEVTKAPVRVSVGKAADGIVALEWDDHRIAFRPLPAAVLGEVRDSAPTAAQLDALAPLPAEPPVVAGRAADVTAVLAGVDLRVVAQPYGAKSFLVLAAPIPDNAFTFLVNAPGLTLRATERGALEFVDDASGKPIAEMPAPYAVDSTPDEFTGSGRTTTDVRYELGSLGKQQTVTITVDPAWLATAVYPVYVDPTTNVYNEGTSAYGDVHVNQGNPSFNYANYLRPDAPGYYEMWLGESPSNATYWNEAYVKFDLTQVAGQVIDAASFEVRPYHQYYNAPTATNAYVRRVTADWTEAMTWATGKAAYTNTGVTYTGCVEGQQCAFSVLGWVRDWVDKDLPNYGLHLSEIGTDNVRRGPTYWKRLISAEHATTIVPRLIVTHHAPTTAVYPVSGPTGSRTVSWAVDPLWGQTRFRVDVASDPGFTAIVATSGDVMSSATSWAVPPATTLTEGTTYHWRVRSDHATNAWGSWAVGSFTPNLTLLGSQPQQRTEGWDLGGGDSLAVNASTLNAVVSHPIVSLPIRGGSFGLNLVHNAQDPASVGMGRGWRLDAFRRLTVNPANGWVTLTDGTGARHTFANPSGSGTITYTRPATIYATLSRNTGVTPHRFTLTYRDRTVDVFDELSPNTGYLVAERDRSQNTITYGYTGTNLVTIDDPVGRRIDLTWSGTNLTQIQDWAYVDDGKVQATATGSRRTHRFFYDASSRLVGWADPLNTTATCPANPTTNTASHLTCLGYDTNGYLTTITKAQTVATLSGGAIGTASPRSITTQIDNFGTGEVRDVRDAEQYDETTLPNTLRRNTFRRIAGLVEVVRQGTPDSTTRYAVPGAADPYGRITSVKRKLLGAWIEQRTEYNDAQFPIEPTTIVDNYINGTVGDGSNATVDDRTTKWAYVLDSLGLVRTVTEPLTATLSRITDYAYNDNDDLTQTIVNRSPADASQPSVTTRYCYDAACGTDPINPTLTMSRQIQNYVDGTAGNGAANVEDITTTYQYDTFGQLTRETRANYDAAGGTPRDSRAIGHTYDAVGNLTSDIVNYDNGSVTSAGDDIDPNSVTNARTDLTTTYGYDTAGNRISTADPRRAIEAAKGSCLYQDDYVSRSTFDPLGAVVATREPTTPDPSCPTTQGTTTITHYDELGGVRQTTDHGGLITASKVDRLGHVTATYEDPAGAALPALTSAATYDAAGRTLTTKDRRQVADATLGWTSHEYDELGRETGTTEASGAADPTLPSTTLRSFDALDRQTSETAGSDAAAAQTTVTRFDLAGRATATDDEFTCTSTTYDYRDRPMAITEGQATGVCTGAGTRTTTISTDRLGRVTLRSVDASNIPEATTYDGAGNVLTKSGTQAGVTTTSTYMVNPLDQVIVETRTGGSTAKTNYDAAGNATDRCYWQTGTAGACLAVGTTPGPNPPTQASTTLSDARNQRISQTSKLGASSAVATTTYDPAHNYQISAFYLPTAGGKEYQTLYRYDTRHRLGNVVPTDPAIIHQLCTISSGHTCSATSPLGSSAYAYDDNDNRTTVTESSTGGTAATVTYCYDAINRLVAAKATTTCTSAPTETYAYDDAGNRTSATGAGLTRSFSYDAEGQLASCTAPACTITYDATGRSSTITDNGITWTYSYDADGRVISACNANPCSGSEDRVDYRYDGSGHRVQITESDWDATTTTVTTTDFRYEGDTVVQELTNGTVSRSYVTDEAGRIVQVCDPDCVAGTIYVVVTNGHGDTTGLWKQETSGALTLVNSYTYSTWGTPTIRDVAGTILAWNAPANLRFRFLYVGAHDVQWDNSFGSLGLHYMHARHYSPSLGRFIQPDPSAQDENLYAYAEGSPATKADPEGTMTISGILVNAAAGASFEKRYTETVKRFGWTVESVRRYERVKGYGRGRYVDLIISKQTRTGFQRWRIELKVGTSRHVGEPQLPKDMLLTDKSGVPTRLVRSIQGSGGSGIVRVDYIIRTGPKGPAVTFKFEGGQWRHGMPRGLSSGGGGGVDGKLLL